jgi:hypothetical protein
MKYLTLLLLLAILPPLFLPAQNKSEVEILKFGWRKLPRSNALSAKKAQEMRDAAIDSRIRAESMQDQPDYALIRSLEAIKKNQANTLDVAPVSDKAYEYKFRIRNKGVRQIVYIKWLYEFKDAATGQEILRYFFESKVKVGPGKGTEIVAYTNSGPPMVVNAKALGKNKKAWEEETTIEMVEYSDGSRWVKK